MASFEQAASLAARVAVDGVKEQFSPQERMECVWQKAAVELV